MIVRMRTAVNIVPPETAVREERSPAETPFSHGPNSSWTNGPRTRMPQRPRTTLGIAASISTSDADDAPDAVGRDFAEVEPDRDRDRAGDQHGESRDVHRGPTRKSSAPNWFVTAFQLWCQRNEMPNADREPGARDDPVDDQADQDDREPTRRPPRASGARSRRSGPGATAAKRARAAQLATGASMRAELYSSPEGRETVHQPRHQTFTSPRPGGRTHERDSETCPPTCSNRRHLEPEARDQAPVARRDVVFGIDDLSVHYGTNLALWASASTSTRT